MTNTEMATVNRSSIVSRYVDGSYLQHNSTWHVEDSPWKANQIHRMLVRHHIQPATIGEIGCGAGEIIRQLSLKYPTTSFSGYELSPQAYELCTTRESDRLSFFNVDLLDTDSFFEVLLCIDVFEHVDDYIVFVQKLKPRSTYKLFHIPLDISVWSLLRGSMMKQRRQVGHLHYFTQQTALATLEDCGYHIIDHAYTPYFMDLPAKTVKAWLARQPRKWLYSLAPDLMVKLTGGCSLLVLAQ